MFSLLRMENDDVIWVKFCRQKSGENRDIFIGTCHFNSSTCQSTDQKISKLSEIVNSRKTGDPSGDFTCIKCNGNSLVDYRITSPSTYENFHILRSDVSYHGSRITVPSSILWKSTMANTMIIRATKTQKSKPLNNSCGQMIARRIFSSL